MLYKDLKARELFSTMLVTEDVAELFGMGLYRDNDRLAGSAMEELVRRDRTDLIVEKLEDLYQKTPDILSYERILFILMRDLNDCCREKDPVLGLYAKEGVSLKSPTEWLVENAKYFKETRRSGIARDAKPWARKYLVPEEAE